MTQPTAGPTAQQWSPTPGRAIEPTRGPAMVALGAAVFVLVVSVAQTILAFPVGRALAAGEEPDYVWDAGLLTGYDVAGMVYGLAVTAAWISTCVWLARARRNAEAISTLRHDRSRVWVWLGWVVPVVSLWFPRQVVRDVHLASDPEHDLPERLNLWWGLWLVSVFASNAADRITLSGDLDMASMLWPFNAAATVAMVGALVPWVVIVRRIVTLQEAAAARNGTGVSTT